MRQSLVLEDVMNHVHQAETATILITKALEESEKELTLTKEVRPLLFFPTILFFLFVTFI